MEEKDLVASGRSGISLIEFDGNTVLCRVCGDRASGFHYGVHACEGCKGFFRRSIQQKIQYRPCIKNQHCLITRVNRNRCQYCRLKKCIAIGMSRDAVRFGRVPKREKAKILEQMQKVNLQCYDSGSADAIDEVELLRRIIEAYEQTCQFTSEKAAIFKEEARRKGNYVTCPSKMACPLNPSPDVEYSSVDRLSLYSNGFMPAIHNIVTFAKLIPGFTNLNQDDQIMLLKFGTFEILLLQLSCLFDSKSNTMFFTNENIFLRKPQSPSTGSGYLLGSVFDFSERMMNLNLTDAEMALFSAFILFSPDRPGLQNSCTIERFQSVISQLLKTETQNNHVTNPDLFDKLIAKIPEMRLLNTVHSEKLLGLTVPSTLAHHCPPNFHPSVPHDVQPPPSFWGRGLLPNKYYNNPSLVSEWYNRTASSGSNEDREKERKKRKLEENEPFETDHILKTEIPQKQLKVGCRQVQSTPEVVLATPLGTFHRMPLTPWSSDHRPSDDSEAMRRCDDFDRSEMRSSKESGSPLLHQRGLSWSPSNHLHHKKKVARVWSCDSVPIKELPSIDEMIQECDSTNRHDNDNRSTTTTTKGESTQNPYNKNNLHKRLFSDFNINSRFLSYEPTPKVAHKQNHPIATENIQTSSIYPPVWSLPKYAKNIPFPMALWSNCSSVPFYLPPSFSASDSHQGFKTPLTLLDHLMRRDDNNPLGMSTVHPSDKNAKEKAGDPVNRAVH